MSRKKQPAEQFSSDEFEESQELVSQEPGAGSEEQLTPSSPLPAPSPPRSSVSELGASQEEPAKPHTIEVWCGQVSLNAYMSGHVETRLYGREGEALKRLAVGLNQRNERLEDGTHVNSQPTAIRWLLQRLAEEFLGPLPE
jgi:hypothetical protein